MTICEQFSSSAIHVKQWFKRQPEVKEESMTDWLLDDLASKLPTIGYKQFSRHEESNVSGADWEWWFILAHNKFFSSIVQAKKLFPRKDNYDGLMHKPKATKRRPKPDLQIKTFRNFAKTKGVIALYAFYSLEESANCPKGKKEEGVFITTADVVHRSFIRTRKRKILPERVTSKCVPLSCMMCCQLISPSFKLSDSLPKEFSLFLRDKFDPNGATTPSDVFTGRLPAYVERVIRESTGQGGDFLIDTDRQVPICRKVLVTDLRSIY